MTNRWRALTIAVAAVAALLDAGPALAAGPVAGHDGVIRDAGVADAVKDRYIVVLGNTAATPHDLTARYGGSVTREYTAALHGFAVHASAARARRLAADPAVAYVLQDRSVHVATAQPDPPSWGLDRIDQRARPLDHVYSYPTRAANVTAYVIDTGIRISHETFGGRARYGWDFVDNDAVADDCDGHGTHVAGTIGGREYGVAKGVQLVAVRVLDCTGSGYYSQVIAGVDWVTKHAVKPAVANMSIGGPTDASVDDAVRASIRSGVTYAIAAGNENINACSSTPARTGEAITVGAVDSTDNRAPFSNYGRCVDIFAPGVSILSAYKNSNRSTTRMSGTSMATPHVAGAAALVLAAHPGASPATVAATLVGRATTGLVRNAGSGSPNRLLSTVNITKSLGAALH
jgi:subtilisin family serine protease